MKDVRSDQAHAQRLVCWCLKVLSERKVRHSLDSRRVLKCVLSVFSMVNSCVLFEICLVCYVVKSALCLASQRQHIPCDFFFVFLVFVHLGMTLASV